MLVVQEPTLSTLVRELRFRLGGADPGKIRRRVRGYFRFGESLGESQNPTIANPVPNIGVYQKNITLLGYICSNVNYIRLNRVVNCY
jgi:hypothetical protein